jgi:hypothetical protein
MSFMEIFAFNREGDAEDYGDARNSWGGAMHIWNSLSKKYGFGDFPMMRTENVPIWEACTEGKLNEHDTVTCKFTFDRVWVKSENIPRLIESLCVFVREFVDGTNVARTLPAAIEILQKAHSDPGVIGVAFNQTSVGEAWCGQIPIPCEHCGGTDTDDYRPYNLHKDEGHWELFESIDNPKDDDASI